MKQCRLFLLALFCAAFLALSIGHCVDPKFDCSDGTLRENYDYAKLVLLGTLSKRNGTTLEVQVENVLKDHPLRGGAKVVLVPYALSFEPKKADKFLVFLGVDKDRLYLQGIRQVQGAAVIEYLAGALKVGSKDTPTQLRYAFEWLGHADEEIALDARVAVARAEYKYIQIATKDYPPDKFVAWLRDQSQPDARLGLYGFLLGHCGKDEHARILDEMLSTPRKALRVWSGVEGLFTGYTLLNPEEGWRLTRNVMADSYGHPLRSGFAIIAGGPGKIMAPRAPLRCSPFV